MNDTSFSGFEADSLGQLQRDFTEIELVRENHVHRLYRAKRFGRWYMLKTLSPEVKDSAAHQQMLLKEMDILMRLQHPGIVGCLGMEQVTLDEMEGVNCIVMEYIDGQTLAEWLPSSSAKEAERILSQLLAALAYLHSAGITHRDLKPSNVMLTRNGHFVRLIDFSLADTDTHAILKQPSGTAKYMSPEQRTATSPDVRNDIYSLGVIMQQMPLGGYWRKIAERCLLPIEQRYANIAELQADIDRHQRRAARRRWALPLALLAMILLAGAAAIIKLDADRRTMYQQLYRVPIAKEKSISYMEEQIDATGLTTHIDTLSDPCYLDPLVNDKLLAVNASAYDYAEACLADFSHIERDEILTAMLDRWQAWSDSIQSVLRPSCRRHTSPGHGLRE